MTQFDDEYISQAEAARLKKVSRQAVSLAIKDGRLNCIKIAGRAVLRKEDVEKWTIKEVAVKNGSTEKKKGAVKNDRL